MKLSEKCKDYFVILEQNSKTKSEIGKKLLDIIVQCLDCFATEIFDFSYSAGERINVIYYYRCHSEYNTDDCSIPIEWLDLDMEKIKDIVTKREKEREKEAELEAKRIQEMEEVLERSLYERLKKKFEG